MRRFLMTSVAVAGLVGVTSCLDREEPTAPRAGPSPVISLAGHEGNTHFYFLPPFVPDPSPTGTFDGTLSPVVHICEWVESACEQSVATFSMDADDGSEAVRVVPEDEDEHGHYIVNWHSDRYELQEYSIYRIIVLVAGTPLGYADVQVVPRGAGGDGDYFALEYGRTLPIKFRIEQGAVYVVGPTGGTITAAEGAVELVVPEGALEEEVGITVRPLTEQSEDVTLIPGAIYDFGPDGTEFTEPVQLTIMYDELQLPEGTEEWTLILGERHDGGDWKPTPHSVVDETAHTVTAPIHGFSADAIMESPLVQSQQILVGRIEAGSFHTCSVTPLGTAYCWGLNSSGQLGDGTREGAQMPTLVEAAPSALQLFRDITAGWRHTCGLTTTDEAYCWGRNFNGELGDGTTSSRPTPEPVADGLTFRTLTAGSSHTCGVATTGEAYCWGRNHRGQIGDGGSEVDRLTPFPVVGGLSFRTLTAGSSHTCGLTTTGVAWCWGANDAGQGGVGVGYDDLEYPSRVQSGSYAVPRFLVLTAGADHTCGVATTGEAYCWGWGRLTPEPVADGLTFRTLTAGFYHVCGVTTTGEDYCWGNNDEGQLGDGTRTYRYTPKLIGASFSLLFAGGLHTCGVDTTGKAWCWGDNSEGQLGDGTIVEGRVRPTAVRIALWGEVSAGKAHTCALGEITQFKLLGDYADPSEIYCWGLNIHGELGDGTSNGRSRPGLVAGGLSGFDIISSGGTHTCAVQSSVDVYCWGEGAYLGTGTTASSDYEPRQVLDGGRDFYQVSADLRYSCALGPTPSGPLPAGNVYCWGQEWPPPELGLDIPARVPWGLILPRDANQVSVSAGDGFACSLTATGRVFCWHSPARAAAGGSSSGELGDGTWEADTTAGPVTGGHTFTALSVGESHACGVTSGGEIYCWGRNASGQLGDGTTDDRSSPVGVLASLSFSSVSAGASHTCAVTQDGAAYCWGDNWAGQLGDESTTGASLPVPVHGGRRFVSVTAGGDHTCGLTYWYPTGGGYAIYCWGADSDGQLGRWGRPGDSTTPLRIVSPIPQ